MVKPRRQVSAPQHSAVVAHASWFITHEHALAPKSQSEQLPLVGPLAVPLWQVPVASHQPQPEAAAQVPHEVWVAHGSAEGHIMLVHAQPVQLPEVGPAEVPRWQPVPGHQPQGYTAVQLPQSVRVVQPPPQSPA